MRGTDAAIAVQPQQQHYLVVYHHMTHVNGGLAIKGTFGNFIQKTFGTGPGCDGLVINCANDRGRSAVGAGDARIALRCAIEHKMGSRHLVPRISTIRTPHGPSDHSISFRPSLRGGGCAESGPLIACKLVEAAQRLGEIMAAKARHRCVLDIG